MKDNIERRYGTIEWRADEKENRKVRGIASVVEEQYRVGWFDEVIAKGAFDNALKDSDIRILFNHDPSQIVGRSGKNSAEVGLNDHGDLTYSFIAPDTTTGNDLMENLRLGLVSQSSFGFSIARKGEEWSIDDNGRDVRTVTNIQTLYDVSPVTYPASPSTSVAEARFAQVHVNGFVGDELAIGKEIKKIIDKREEEKPKPNADKTVKEELVYNNLDNFKRKVKISKKKYNN